jgi:hypothetical protein
MHLFDTNPRTIKDLLAEAKSGKMQLPEFQRSWVWSEEGIKDLIVSVLNGFPVGAIMVLEVGGQVNFKPRPIEGVSLQQNVIPSLLILDGQQRTTSMYLSMYNDKAVKTTTVKGKEVNKYYYIDIQKAIAPNSDLSDVVKIVPENKILKDDNKTIDLSTKEFEYENLYFPLSKTFDWSTWQADYITTTVTKKTPDEFQKAVALINQFYKDILEPVNSYSIPVISLTKNNAKEAVCLVFEKVNTGGKPLDAFELITAIYAADEHDLREDWYGDDKNQNKSGIEAKIHSTLIWPKQEDGILTGVQSTDFFQVISLLYTEEKHQDALNNGMTGKQLPEISAKRRSLLEVPLDAYLKYRDIVEKAFITAGQFLVDNGIYRIRDLPYQSQVTALAAIITKLGTKFNNAAVKDNLSRWYWCGIFGELYGSSIETRIAYDFVQVPEWAKDPANNDVPYTVRDANFNIGRLVTMRSKLSAAYKGLSVLIAKSGAKDYITGQPYTLTLFMQDNVDIDHIFAQNWCKKQNISKDIYDSIINKTPISPKTNRGIVSDKSPSVFIADIQKVHGLSDQQIDDNLQSHLIDSSLLRKDDFEAFYNKRKEQLANLIEQKMNKQVNRQSTDDD